METYFSQRLTHWHLLSKSYSQQISILLILLFQIYPPKTYDYWKQTHYWLCGDGVMEMVEKSGENIVVVVQHGEGRRGNRDYLKNYRRYLLVWISSSCQARRSICLQVSRLQLASCNAKLPASCKLQVAQNQDLIRKWQSNGWNRGPRSFRRLRDEGDYL